MEKETAGRRGFRFLVVLIATPFLIGVPVIAWSLLNSPWPLHKVEIGSARQEAISLLGAPDRERNGALFYYTNGRLLGWNLHLYYMDRELVFTQAKCYLWTRRKPLRMVTKRSRFVESLANQVTKRFAPTRPDAVRLTMLNDTTIVFWIGMGQRVILHRLPDGAWLDTRFRGIFGDDGVTNLRLPINRRRREALKELYSEHFEREYYNNVAKSPQDQ